MALADGPGQLCELAIQHCIQACLTCWNHDFAGILLMEYCAGRDLRSALGLTAAGSNERLFGW